MKVGLLVTGRMEAEGLPLFLKGLFPEHSFYSITKRDDGTPFDGFTSSPVGMVGMDIPTNLTKIIEALCAELVPGRKGGERPDFIFVLDDLEIANLDQPALVTQRFIEAVRLHLDTLPTNLADRVEIALQQQASFHLAVPMIESWLFAHDQSLLDAGVPHERLPPQLVNCISLEDFCTSDQAFALDQGCTAWTGLTEEQRQQKRYKNNWKPLWLIEEREKHPKAYISWLCRNEQEKKCSTYRESGGREEATGAKALASLDYNAVSERIYPFFFSFLEDVANALGATLDNFPQGSTSPLTSIFANCSRTLRNL